ncbi:MAG TPA: AAA family ATPase [Haliangiales bacterium]|nr:AAA family ATPase [Haliangiales bacterium]
MHAVESISSQREVEDLIKARYPLLYLVSSEESRVEKLLKEIARNREMRLEVWSVTEGFKTLFGGQAKRDIYDPFKALEYVAAGEGRGLYILRDFHPFLKEPKVVRKLRDLGDLLRQGQKHLFILSPVQTMPPELEKTLTVIDWDLPNRGEIEGIAKKLFLQIPEVSRQKIQDEPGYMERVVEAALGLTEVEAENVFAKSVVRTKTFDISTIIGEKKQIIRKSGILEYYEAVEDVEDVGGLEILKDWLQKRRHAFTARAREFGLPLPKGILLIGIPGTGKSLTAKCVGSMWGMPLLRLDVGKIFSGLVGSSEENIRKVIKTAEAIAPAVLWLDELEKGFSGTGSSNFSDGGTTSRVFGSFVTWLQEKTSPVFVIATANNVHQLPPELLRKGRFDEIFFCDLPAREERKQIFGIHIRRKKRDPQNFDLDRLAEVTPDFSGAEIETVVTASLYDAFDENSDLDTDRLQRSIGDIVPLAVTMREVIESMREWAKTRARSASAKGQTPAKRTRLQSAGEAIIDNTERKLEI